MRFIVAALLFLTSLPVMANPIDRLTFYTEDFPPYQFVEEGELKGIFVDILQEAFKRTDTIKTIDDFNVVPWARGYEIVLTTPNTVLFSTARTPAREAKFRWVGPVSGANHVILARKDDSHRINSLPELNKFLTVTIRDDVAEQLVLEHGVHKHNLIRLSSLDAVMRVLNIKRADFWAYNIDVAYYVLRQYNSADRYEVVFTLQEGDAWIALNPDSSQEAEQALQTAIEAVRRSPVYDEILARYR